MSLPFPSLLILHVLLIRPHEWIQYRNKILPCNALQRPFSWCLCSLL
jgi:hypothetical protein